jgi:SAM-dependent methyltransferase
VDLAEQRRFYDRDYHFGEDVEAPGLARLWHAVRHLEPLAGSRVLDVGCGVGWAAHLASEHGAAVTGLDFSATALDLAARSVAGPSWVQGDGGRLPFADGSFDRLLSFGSLEHFPDVPAALVEVRRVLRPGARAVVVVPNAYVRTEQPREVRLSRGGWARLFRAAGLAVLHVGADRGPSLRCWREPLRLVRRLAGRAASLVPGLQYQFVFVLERA